MNGTRVDHGHRDQTCLTGTVVLTPTGGIGATNGVLVVEGHSVRIRQVPGPNNRGVPLSTLNGRQASVCGRFIFDAGEVLLSVTYAEPLLLQ